MVMLLLQCFLMLNIISHAMSLGSQPIQIKAAPSATVTALKEIRKVGEKVKLSCPIEGFPTPMIEWKKDGELIDYTWPRYRTNKRFLRIKSGVTKEDTGIFICKGINGFGSTSVRIELIVVDSRPLSEVVPKSLGPLKIAIGRHQVAAPVFTSETRTIKKLHRESVGEMFEIMCEALGSPTPDIFWFKDGHHIYESVSHIGGGRSTVSLRILGTADAGVYTCRASNLFGSVAVNYTLDVIPPQLGMGNTMAIVTEAGGPKNSSVMEGESATLFCKVKSLGQPHIKWLKRLKPGAASSSNNMYTLNVGNDFYRVLPNGRNTHVGQDEYLSKMIIPQTKLEDSGMYICFVTNSGFGQLTYKSVFLGVKPRLLREGTEGEQKIQFDPIGSSRRQHTTILILVTTMAVIVLVLLTLITVCVIKRKACTSDSLQGLCSNRRHKPPSLHKGCQPLPSLQHAVDDFMTAPFDDGRRSRYWPQTGLVYPASQTRSSKCYAIPNSNVFMDDTNCNHYEVPFSHNTSSEKSSCHKPKRGATTSSTSSSLVSGYQNSFGQLPPSTTPLLDSANSTDRYRYTVDDLPPRPDYFAFRRDFYNTSSSISSIAKRY